MDTGKNALFRGDPRLPGYLVTDTVNKTVDISVSGATIRIPEAIYKITAYQRSILEQHVVSYLTQLSLACVDVKWPAWFQDLVQAGILGSDHRLPTYCQRFYRQGIFPAFKGERPMNLTDVVVLRCLTFSKVTSEVSTKLERIDCSWMLGHLDFPSTEFEVIRHKGTPLESLQAVGPASLVAPGRCRMKAIPKRDPVVYKVYKNGVVTVRHSVLGHLEFTTSVKAMKDCVTKAVIVEGVENKTAVNPVSSFGHQASVELGDGIEVNGPVQQPSLPVTQESQNDKAVTLRWTTYATKGPIVLALFAAALSFGITVMLGSMKVALVPLLRVAAGQIWETIRWVVKMSARKSLGSLDLVVQRQMLLF
ncbi:hypothetical protein CMQ_8289 [Grosmannia clavigera kw1407]|uniref:Uncharacterized protein n=1 Tax=Grosmannia clavigera (strain kw1407 / UAMH 11150) TaxID=655863 RepID=F0XL27_GROCL|nr:uncharacterized protein CMQ_8289 [Grosmannia clavigera kw1407]EFX01823.1 hypothetical protein CMQ_8289 [Grosmannia clavigera kw1407]